MVGLIVASTAGSHSLTRNSLTLSLVVATKFCSSTETSSLFIAAAHSFCVLKPAMRLTTALLGLDQAAAAGWAGALRATLDPEPLVAALAALRCRKTDIDDVLPAAAALGAAVTDGAPHDSSFGSIRSRRVPLARSLARWDSRHLRSRRSCSWSVM